MLESFLGMFLHLLHHPCATAHTELGLVIVGVSAIALRAAELGTVVDHSARALCSVVPRGYSFDFGVKNIRAALDILTTISVIAAYPKAAWNSADWRCVFNARIRVCWYHPRN